MNASTRTSLVTIIIAVALVAVALLVITRIYRGDGQLLRDVSVSLDTVTPNADGDSDITPIVYEITRNADVSIYFENEDGDRYYFREAKPRGVGQYRVLFSGVVDGRTLPGEQIQGEIMARLLPDDTYKWAVEATDEAGHSEVVSGTLTVAEVIRHCPKCAILSSITRSSHRIATALLTAPKFNSICKRSCDACLSRDA